MAEFEKRLACVIKADGKIVRGYMIDKCEFNGVNEYIITWKSHCRELPRPTLPQRLAARWRSRSHLADYGGSEERPLPDAGTHL